MAVATHDDALVGEAQRLADERRLGPDRYEFQLLLGVKEDAARPPDRGRPRRPHLRALRRGLVRATRVRRLKENPSIAGYVARDAVRGLAGRR